MVNLRARWLRANPTEAERALWKKLRELKPEGFHFRRQVPIGVYIADFACHSVRLVIEVDGGQHGWDHEMERDQSRSLWLESQGYRVLRFWNSDVLTNMDGVMRVVRGVLGLDPLLTLPTPNPSP